MQTIYCVEDDQNIRELTIYALSSSGFEAVGFECATPLFAALEKRIPHLILLDIMLPGKDGMEILRELREQGKTQAVPVILLTAKTSEWDKVRGLDMGADDYITKPFGVMELISRVKAVLRRSKGEVDGTFRCGGVQLDYPRRSVSVDGKDVLLTYKEFELLYYLMKNEGVVLTREKLMNEVWGFDFEGESRTVDVHIRTLRQKLGEGGGMIETVRNVGYKAGARHVSDHL